MGVALALVLVCSLGAAFLPANTPGGPETAEAGDLTWSTITFPTGTSSVLVGANEDLGPVAISPNFAEDNTVWASVVDVTTAARPMVYKSTNGGHTWAATTTATLGTAAGDYVVDLKASPQYATDNTVFVVTQANAGGINTGRVYRSVNGGSSFGQMGIVTLAANEVITSFDVAPNYDGTGTLAVGVADVRTGTQATAANCFQMWGVNGVLSWSGTSVAVGATTDISALMYSPNYTMDSTILVVASSAGVVATTNPYLRAIVGGVWDGITATLVNATGAVAVQIGFADAANAVGNNILRADIAMPSDYNGQVSTTRRAYVSIVSNGAGGAELGNVYRITNVTAGSDITGSTGNMYSNLEYRGTFAEGTLLAGLWGAAAATQADVHRTTNPTSSVVNWYGVSGAANMPTGTCGPTANTTAFIAAAADFATSDTPTVVVGTMGNDSAFGASIDGAASFNERGLIDNDAGAQGAGGEDALATLTDVALPPNYATGSYLYLVTENDSAAATDANVWRRDKGTSLWERCFTANFVTPGTGVIGISNEFATDSVLYVGDVGGTAIYYSANGGQSWSARAVAAGLGVTIQTVAAPDATTVYVGDNAGVGNVAKSTNSGWTWPSAMMKNSGSTAPVVSLKVVDSTVLVGGSAGSVRRSDDGGSTWSKVSATFGGGGAVYVDFDGTTVYAADAPNANVYRSVDAGGWQEIGAATSPAAGVAIDLILAEDGTLYEADTTVLQDVYRSISPTAAVPSPNTTWEAMTAPGNATTGTAVNLTVMDVVGGSNTITIIDATPAIRQYTDTLSAGVSGPSLVSPADGSTLGRGQTTRFTIEAMAGVTAYAVRWSTDPTIGSGWTNMVIAAPSVQTAAQAGLPDGVNVYWRARATAPFLSPWSEIWSFETELATAVVAPVPAYPAGDDVMNIALKPVFNWGAFKYASGYEFQLANDSGMTDLKVDLSGDSALGLITSYVLTDALDYSSTYYWRVRAIKGTSTAYSDWSAIVGFTTMAEPEEPAPPIIIEPTPAPAPAPAPSTPAYIWAIIAICAVLVIVVIVLIVRTRRVA